MGSLHGVLFALFKVIADEGDGEQDEEGEDSDIEAVVHQT